MKQAQKGDTVSVHYTGKLEDGTVFDSSREREPLEFTIGAGRVVPGFEDAVVGMNQGDSVTKTVPCDKAYGPKKDELTIEVARQQIPNEIELEIGQRLQMGTADGRTVPVQVADLGEETVTLDANHPLAGKDLTFEIELVEIKE